MGQMYNRFAGRTFKRRVQQQRSVQAVYKSQAWNIIEEKVIFAVVK